MDKTRFFKTTSIGVIGYASFMMLAGCSTIRFTAVSKDRVSPQVVPAHRYCLQSLTVDPQLRTPRFFLDASDEKLREAIVRDHPEVFESVAGAVPVRVGVRLGNTELKSLDGGLNVLTLSLVPMEIGIYDDIRVEVSVGDKLYMGGMSGETVLKTSLFPFVLMSGSDGGACVDSGKRFLFASWNTRNDGAFRKALGDTIIGILGR